MSEDFCVTNWKSVLILGWGEIGSALGKEIKVRNRNCTLIGTTRSKEKVGTKEEGHTLVHLEALSEESWGKLEDTLSAKAENFDAIISTIGILHNEKGVTPERSLKEVNLRTLQEVFAINCFSVPLAARYLEKFLSKESPSAFVFLSAKVGSIKDNRLGGWYSYRASKAALNMFVKTLAIEFERKAINTSLLAIHPGTTRSKLSSPFIKRTQLKVWNPDQTAKHILDTIEKSQPEGSGLFKNWDGTDLEY